MEQKENTPQNEQPQATETPADSTRPAWKTC